MDPVNDPRFELIERDLLDHKHHTYSVSDESCCDMISEQVPLELRN